MMTANYVVVFCQAIDGRGVRIWIDGGWGVDALLERQTRPHDDLDIVVEEKDVPAVRALLVEWGYGDVPRDDTRPWNFVMGDKKGHEVDFHVVLVDDHGNGVYGPGNFVYPAAALAGIGSIAGCQVNCIAPEFMVQFHTGYPLREKDFHDVWALCQRFGLEMPGEYRTH